MKMPGNWKSRSLVIITLDQNVVGQLALQAAIHREGWIFSSWGFGMMMSTRRMSIHLFGLSLFGWFPVESSTTDVW